MHVAWIVYCIAFLCLNIAKYRTPVQSELNPSIREFLGCFFGIFFIVFVEGGEVFGEFSVGLLHPLSFGLSGVIFFGYREANDCRRVGCQSRCFDFFFCLSSRKMHMYQQI